MKEESKGPQEALGSDEYDEGWLESAWGAEGNRELLQAEKLISRPRVTRALELVAPQPGMRVLDIACGRGEVPALISLAGAEGIGIDFSAAALEFAARLRERRRGRAGDGEMELVRADACHIPFADASFERVTMLDIVEHLVPAQLDAMFCEVRRVLKPGGYAVVHTLPNRWVYDITFPLLHRIMPRLPRDPRGPYDRRVHINEQDLPTLSTTLSRCGLRHRLWLEQWMPAQARWNAGRDRYGDNRDTLYPFLAGPVGRVLEWASHTPFKLLLSNDIFGILWHSGAPPAGLRLPWGWSERVLCRLSTRQ